jgi:hypothetical protein
MRLNKQLYLTSVIIVLAANLAALLSGCGKTQATISPSPSPNLLPPLTGAPPSATLIDPNALPAAFRVSNFEADALPAEGDNEWEFSLDVENTGGQPGIFTAIYRIDNDPAKNDSKKINLAPGQKKRIELLSPRQDIVSLGEAYDAATINERQHVVYCGDLFITIELAERPKLKITKSEISEATGQVTVNGEVMNISQEKMVRFIAVVDFGDADEVTVKTAEAPVIAEFLDPGQTTQFSVTLTDDIAVKVYWITFKDAAGGRIRATIAATGG